MENKWEEMINYLLKDSYPAELNKWQINNFFNSIPLNKLYFY